MNPRDFFNRAGSLTLARVLQGLLQAAVLIWLARIDKSGYGLYIFGMSLAMPAGALLTLGLDHYTIREAADRPGEGRALALRMIRIKVVGAGLVLLGLLLIGWSWSGPLLSAALVLTGARLLDSLAQTFYSFYRAAGRQFQEGLTSSLAQAIGVAYGITALVLGWGPVAVVSFMLLSGAVRLALAWTIGSRLGLLASPDSPAEGHRPLLSGPLPTFFGLFLAGAVFNSMPVYLLKYFGDLTAVAEYGAAADLVGEMVGIGVNLVIGGVLFPSLAGAFVRSEEEFLGAARRYIRQALVAGPILGGLVAGLGPWGLVLVMGPEFTPSGPVLRLLCPALVLSLFNNIVIQAALVQKRERAIFKIQLLPLAVGLVCGWLLIPGWGALGAAGSLVAARLSVTVPLGLLSIQWFGRWWRSAG